MKTHRKPTQKTEQTGGKTRKTKIRGKTVARKQMRKHDENNLKKLENARKTEVKT